MIGRMILGCCAALVVILLAFGCSFPADYEPRYDIPVFGFTTVRGIGGWIDDNCTYVSDEIHDTNEYWQSPDQTYTWRCGDCEDFAILMMYFIHIELGGEEPLLVAGRTGAGEKHGWVRWEGVAYEAQDGFEIPDGYVENYTIGYREALWRSETSHRNVVEGVRP
ncbi:MAG: hypothetical protein NTZ09_04215 [Candidatus Hydrogenedentes bacterium]|nr:hypothetical protein [Candidatus Hydrogenedentota bacterium]